MSTVTASVEQGGVQPHSQGEHYPIIIVGHGDGTWTAEYAGYRTAHFQDQRAAEYVARIFKVLHDSGPGRLQAHLRQHGYPLH